MVTLQTFCRAKATLGEEEVSVITVKEKMHKNLAVNILSSLQYKKIIEKSERRRKMERARQYGYTQARRERKAAGKQTEKDKIHFEKKRKHSKRIYYEKKAEEYLDQKQNALKNANFAALSQIDDLFKTHQPNKKQKRYNSSAAKDS